MVRDLFQVGRRGKGEGEGEKGSNRCMVNILKTRHTVSPPICACAYAYAYICTHVPSSSPPKKKKKKRKRHYIFLLRAVTSLDTLITRSRRSWCSSSSLRKAPNMDMKGLLLSLVGGGGGGGAVGAGAPSRVLSLSPR